VAREIGEGTLGGEFDRSDRADLHAKVRDAEDAAKDEVWGDYRYAIVADAQVATGLKVIDLGAGHSSGAESLCGRVISALRSEALLNESVGAGYIDRNWPEAFKETGAWPLASLRQSFLNGSLTRLIDPDAVLKAKVVDFVGKGEFGLASGARPDGTYERMWFHEFVAPEEVAFDAGVFLLKKDKARSVKAGAGVPAEPVVPPERRQPETAAGSEVSTDEAGTTGAPKTLHIAGCIPYEMWNRFGTRVLPKLRSGSDLKIGIDFSVTVIPENAATLPDDLRQILQELGLGNAVKVE
jgi:hypothetical protein